MKVCSAAGPLMPVIDQYGTFSRSSSAFVSNVGHGERNVRDGRVSSQWQSGLSRNGRNGRQLPGSVGLQPSGTAAFLLTSAIARRGRSDCFAPKADGRNEAQKGRSIWYRSGLNNPQLEPKV
jgi:hypothetical protein